MAKRGGEEPGKDNSPGGMPTQPKAPREELITVTAPTIEGKVAEMLDKVNVQLTRAFAEIDKVTLTNVYHRNQLESMEGTMKQERARIISVYDQEFKDAKAYVDKEIQDCKTYAHDNFTDKKILDAKLDALDTEYQNLKTTIQTEDLRDRLAALDVEFHESLAKLNTFGAQVDAFSAESVRWSAEQAEKTDKQDQLVAQKVEDIFNNRMEQARAHADAQNAILTANLNITDATVKDMKDEIANAFAVIGAMPSNGQTAAAQPSGPFAQSAGDGGQVPGSLYRLMERVTKLEQNRDGGGGGGGPPSGSPAG